MDISRLLNRLPGINPVEQMQLKNVLSESTETRGGDTVNNSRQEQASGGEQHVPDSSHQAARENIVWQDMQGRRQAEQSYGMYQANIPGSELINNELSSQLRIKAMAAIEAMEHGVSDSVSHRYQQQAMEGEQYEQAGSNQARENIAWQDMQGRYQAGQSSGIAPGETAGLIQRAADTPGVVAIKTKLAGFLNSEMPASDKFLKMLETNQIEGGVWSDKDMRLAAGIHYKTAAKLRIMVEGSQESAGIRRQLAGLLNNISAPADRFRVINYIKREQNKNWSDRSMQLAAGISSRVAVKLKRMAEGTQGSREIQSETGEPLKKAKSSPDRYRMIRQINREQDKNWPDSDMQLAAGIQASAAFRIRKSEEASPGSMAIKTELAELLSSLTSPAEKHQKICQINLEQNKNWPDKDMQRAAGIVSDEEFSLESIVIDTPAISAIRSDVGDLLDNIAPANDKYRVMHYIKSKEDKNWLDSDIQQVAGISSGEAARLKNILEGSQLSAAIKRELGESLSDIPSINGKYRYILQINHGQRKSWPDKDMRMAAEIHSSAAARVRAEWLETLQ